MQSTPTYSLFVGDLAISCNEDDLYKIFATFGNVTEVRIKRNQITSRSLQYGFVDYSNAISALSAINSLNGALFKGRPLK